MQRTLTKAFGQDASELAAEQKRLLLSRLLSRLAHEIRNPLSSMDIHVQLLEEDLAQVTPQIKEKAAHRFDIIRGELHRLNNIVNHFLQLAGPLSLDLQPVQPGDIVRHVCELLEPEAAARGIELITELPPRQRRLQADPAQLTQALVNLVINAIQAVGQSGRITVRTQTDEASKMLLLQVHDNGPGVPAGKRSTIFEPFFTTKEQGSGLGLWIVQQIIMAHGGHVGVSDAPGGGAIFVLQLPLRKVES